MIQFPPQKKAVGIFGRHIGQGLKFAVLPYLFFDQNRFKQLAFPYSLFVV